MKTIIILGLASLISVSAQAKDTSTLYYEDYAQSSTWPADKASNKSTRFTDSGQKYASLTDKNSAYQSYSNSSATFEEEVLSRDLMGNNIHYP